MPSVVILHAAEDALPARALAEKLRQARLTPMIELPPGEQMHQAIRDAAVTLALWSPRSVGQEYMIEDAAYARANGRLLHARMQNAANPQDFAQDRSVDLTGWRGEDQFAGWQELAALVTEAAGVPPPPQPSQRGPSGFFQPGAPAGARPAPAPAPVQRAVAPPPAPQEPPPAYAPPQRPPEPRAARTAYVEDAPPPMPREGGGRGLIMALVALLVIALVGGGGYFVWSSMQGGQASASDWENVSRTDPAALRAFLNGHPGQYREEASAALSELEEQSFDAAREEDTIDGFRNFLRDFPDSDHAMEARGRIAELQSLPAGEDTLTTGLAPGATSTAVSPDLLPPGAQATTTQTPATQTPATPAAPDDGGPAALTPPPADPAPAETAPAPAPSNQPPTF